MAAHTRRDGAPRRGNRNVPKELIYDYVTTNAFQVKVSWDRDAGHVQVASIADNSEQRVRDILDSHEHDPNGDLFGGWHVTLDRDGINQLIRVLRRARNAAFGADE
jgi:hypothetical protein